MLLWLCLLLFGLLFEVTVFLGIFQRRNISATACVCFIVCHRIQPPGDESFKLCSMPSHLDLVVVFILVNLVDQKSITMHV